MRHIIPISGKDSLCTAIVQLTRSPELNYEFVYNPTGFELPEVLVWLECVEVFLHKKIERVGRDLREIIIGYNYFLPGPRSRYCTKESKILPFIEWISGDPCMVYYGIRADEEREGFNNTTSPNIIPVYPLVESKIDLSAVYTILNNFSLKIGEKLSMELLSLIKIQYVTTVLTKMERVQIIIIFLAILLIKLLKCSND